MNKSVNKIIFLFLLIFSFVFFFIHLITYLDPDFGWHLVTGNLILSSGFPKTDPFSYTMPSFPYIEHEWLIDVLYSIAYPLIGNYGLAFLFSILAIATIAICLKKYSGIGSLLFVFATSSFEPFITISPKVAAWLVFSVFNFLVFNKKVMDKYWYFVPLVMLLWVNIHGSYPLGLLILLIICLTRFVQQKRFLLKELLVLLVSFLTTFVNPYGVKMWWLVLTTTFSQKNSVRISEWNPAFMTLNLFSSLTLLLAVISVVVIVKYRKKYPLEQIITNFLLLATSIFISKAIQLWVIVDLQMAFYGLTLLSKDLGKDGESKTRLEKVLKIGTITACFFVLAQIVNTVYLKTFYFNENRLYPVGAIDYLKNHMPKSQIFADYRWGGYLIWKMPEKKVFSDGRMVTWRRESAPEGESVSTADEYYGIRDGTVAYKPIFDKYNIHTVLLSRNVKNDPVGKFLEMYITSSKFSLEEVLIKDGWVLKYSDLGSVVYQD